MLIGLQLYSRMSSQQFTPYVGLRSPPCKFYHLRRMEYLEYLTYNVQKWPRLPECFHIKARSVGSLGGTSWIPQLLVVTGRMEIPLQQGNALCWAYNGLFIYIFWPQGLGSSGSEAYTYFCVMWFALHLSYVQL